MARFYTGVGSRAVPDHIGSLMWDIALVLKKEGFILRSGGAKGSDSYFEGGAEESKDIYLARNQILTRNGIAYPSTYNYHEHGKAEYEASKYHPAWNRCSEFVKLLHARNTYQVLGHTLDKPSEFLICWTPDGCKSHATRTRETGGTGTAISIADTYGVHVYNLAVEGDRLYWEGIVAQGGFIQTKTPTPQNEAEQHPHKLHTIYTAHYRYDGHDRTDITVSGQDEMGKYFAPTWQMVNGIKNGTLTEQQYIDQYIPSELGADTVVGRVPVKAWNWLLSVPERTFVCFCPKENFCHRNILLNYILGVMNGRVKYGGWLD